MNLNGLTGLRWIAAFYVFLFHVNMRVHLGLPEFLRRIISQGALGVTLFFVLSGFILAYTYYRKKQTGYRTFMFKRLARIYPAYVSGWLLCLGVSLVFNYYPKPFLAVIGLDLAAIQSYFPKLAMVWYGAGAWSISTEFFFYSLFPLALPLLMKLSKRNLMYALAVSVFFSTIPGIMLHILRLPLEFTQVYCFPLARFPEFLSGMCASLLVFKYGVKVNQYLPVAAIITSCVYLYFIGYRLSIVGHNFTAVPTIILLLAAISEQDKPGIYKWIESKTMVYLGKISYGFYIMQLPIMLVLDILRFRGELHWNPWIVCIVVLIVNVLMAVLLYHFVEHPTHTLLVKKLEKSKSKIQADVPVRKDYSTV